MEKAELKELLKESTEKVLFELGKILDKNSSLYNELIILWKRHDDIEREIRLGIIGFEEASRENNKITDSLLKLIDKIENVNEINIDYKSQEKEIAIEDAIEWLSNALIDKNHVGKHEHKNITWKFGHQVKKVETTNNGDFIINIIQSTEIYDKDYYDKLLAKSYLKSNLCIKGRFQDISNVIVQKNHNLDNNFIVIFRATNYKNLFNLIESKVNKKNEITESTTNKNKYRLHFDNYDFALKVKNAIDYLAIHFGRKEDAF